jgi:hypothetical protein
VTYDAPEMISPGEDADEAMAQEFQKLADHRQLGEKD